MYHLTIAIGLLASGVIVHSNPVKVERLLCLATNYTQVEKSVMLLDQSCTTISRIPCISPLQAEDLRRIPVSSSYGNRLHPILNEYKHHSGVDLPGQTGENVYATADGVVVEVQYARNIGNYIKIKHSYGFITVYGHLHTMNVARGDSVKIGKIIGQVGSTGRSTGPHLHYGIKKYGTEQNPLPYCYLYLRWQKMLMSEGKKNQ